MIVRYVKAFRFGLNSARSMTSRSQKANAVVWSSDPLNNRKLRFQIGTAASRETPESQTSAAASQYRQVEGEIRLLFVAA
jgi:hypothetical protein